MQSFPDDLKSIMGPSEQVQLYIRQKIYHPKINIDSVVITNKRIILRHPHALGLKRDYTDFNYRDVSNVIMDKGILRSVVKCTLRFGGEPLALSDLPNSEAERAYGLIRENLVRYQSPFAAPQAGVPPYPQQAAPPTPATGYCRKCGFSMISGEKYCGNCGTPV
ncbi:MAG: PH domain-containing protein [Nitrososphaerota archaeon]|nr:PH domain-containing protein [Nitrososphaerota archaeon]MDG7024836.1 PH domain-containing protein [Nitrososphaerota archaeon]